MWLERTRAEDGASNGFDFHFRYRSRCIAERDDFANTGRREKLYAPVESFGYKDVSWKERKRDLFLPVLPAVYFRVCRAKYFKILIAKNRSDRLFVLMLGVKRIPCCLCQTCAGSDDFTHSFAP